MKLLVDENLPARLARVLAEQFPGSHHVRDIGLERASDTEIWQIALRDEYTLLSKDSDFIDISVVNGHPPKVIWLRSGNRSTHALIDIARSHLDAIRLFIEDEHTARLTLR